MLCITVLGVGHAHRCKQAPVAIGRTLKFVGVFSDIGMQACYPDVIRGQKANANYDWGLLVVLTAVELDTQRVADLTGDSTPAQVQLPSVLK